MWSTAVFGVVLDFRLESPLPEPLRDYLSGRDAVLMPILRFYVDEKICFSAGSVCLL